MKIFSGDYADGRVEYGKMLNKKLSTGLSQSNKIALELINGLGVRTIYLPLTPKILVVTDKAFHEILKKAKKFESDEATTFDKTSFQSLEYTLKGDEGVAVLHFGNDGSQDTLFASKSYISHRARIWGMQLAIRDTFENSTFELVRHNPNVGTGVKVKVTKTAQTAAHRLSTAVLDFFKVRVDVTPVNKEVITIADKAFDNFIAKAKKASDVDVAGFTVLGIEYDDSFASISSDKVTAIIVKESMIESGVAGKISTFEDLEKQAPSLFGDKAAEMLLGVKKIIKSADKVVSNGPSIPLESDYRAALFFGDLIVGVGIDSSYSQVSLKNSRLRDERKSKTMYFLKVCVYDVNTKKYVFTRSSRDPVATLYDSEGPQTKSDKRKKLAARITKVVGVDVGFI